MNQKKQARKRYSEEFKTETLALAGKVGFATVASELGLYESQLYSWRSAKNKNKKAAVSDRETTLAAENARLKRRLAVQVEELDILKKAATHSAKNQS